MIEKVKDKLIAEKDVEIVAANKDAEIVAANKDAEIAVLKEKLGYQTKETLRAKGLMTARGIFEHTVVKFREELEDYLGKKISNSVSAVAKELDVVILESGLDESKAISANLLAIRTDLRKCKLAQPISPEGGIGYGRGPLQSLYSKLCKEVHGAAWSGESVLIRAEEAEDFEGAELCIIAALAKTIGLGVNREIELQQC